MAVPDTEVPVRLVIPAGADFRLRRSLLRVTGVTILLAVLPMPGQLVHRGRQSLLRCHARPSFRPHVRARTAPGDRDYWEIVQPLWQFLSVVLSHFMPRFPPWKRWRALLPNWPEVQKVRARMEIGLIGCG